MKRLLLFGLVVSLCAGMSGECDGDTGMPTAEQFQKGACCYDGGGCITVSEGFCEDRAFTESSPHPSTWLGPGTVCESVTCEITRIGNDASGAWRMTCADGGFISLIVERGVITQFGGSADGAPTRGSIAESADLMVVSFTATTTWFAGIEAEIDFNIQALRQVDGTYLGTLVMTFPNGEFFREECTVILARI